jgi:osmoprotectant transport system ATP-binding protein
LQEEFLRLQRDLRKTIVFVTHDIEEAVHLGDRIAILAEGGHLAQHDTPAAILGAPATRFVADFVGSDRGLKRLSVTRIDPVDLDHPPVVSIDDGLETVCEKLDSEGGRWAVIVDDKGALQGWIGRESCDGDGTVRERARRMGAWVSVDATLKSAFSQMLTEDAGWIAVLDGDRYLGVLTPDSLHAALRRSVATEADS